MLKWTAKEFRMKGVRKKSGQKHGSIQAGTYVRFNHALGLMSFGVSKNKAVKAAGIGKSTFNKIEKSFQDQTI